MHFIPDLLLYRTTGRWLFAVFCPAIRASLWLVWPFPAFSWKARKLLRAFRKKESEKKTDEQRTEEGIEALGSKPPKKKAIIEPEQADLIEQGRGVSATNAVREVMTPRPGQSSRFSADVTLEELHTKFVENPDSRGLPVFEETIDDIVGVAHAQDMLTIADADLPRRKVRDFMKPVFIYSRNKGRLRNF